MHVRGALFAVVVLLAAGCGGQEDPARPPASSATSGPPPASSAAPGGDHQPIPRTRISLRVPDGLTVDPSLPGLGRPNTRTSVMVVEQPVAGSGDTPRGALAQMMAGLTGEKAKTQGIELVPPAEVTVAGFPALVTTGTQRTPEGTIAKAVVVLAAEDVVVIMTGNIQPDDPLKVDELKAVLLDAKWNSQTAAGSMGFDLTAAPGYQRQQSSAGLVFALDGKQGPMLVAAPSIGKAELPADRRGFAVGRFGELPSKPSADSVNEVEIAGLKGFEIVGKDSAKKTAYGVMVFTETGYIQIAADFDSAKYGDQLPAFRAMARSLVLK